MTRCALRSNDSVHPIGKGLGRQCVKPSLSSVKMSKLLVFILRTLKIVQYNICLEAIDICRGKKHF